MKENNVTPIKSKTTTLGDIMQEEKARKEAAFEKQPGDLPHFLEPMEVAPGNIRWLITDSDGDNAALTKEELRELADFVKSGGLDQ